MDHLFLVFSIAISFHPMDILIFKLQRHTFEFFQTEFRLFYLQLLETLMTLW